MSEKAISLYYKDGGSDKVYHAQIEKKLDGYVVNFQYGRRGSTLQFGCKTATPVSLNKAEEVWSKLVTEKTSKGYTLGEDGTPFAGTDKAGAVSGLVPQLLNSINQSQIAQLIASDDWFMQEKMDGFHQMARVSNKDVTISNRNGLIVPGSKAIEIGLSVVSSAVFDGETIGDNYHMFDLLERDGADLRARPALYRIMQLGNYFINFEDEPAIHLVRTAFGSTPKQELFDKIKAERGEGVVFKKKDAPYVPGRPASGGNMLKFKFKGSATCVVIGQNTGKRSVMIAVQQDSTLGFVGPSVGVGSVTIPPNYTIPETFTLVEVEYLYAYPGGALFQAVYKGSRPDKSQADLYSSLKFKQGTDEENDG